jgi:hypothetical protein
MDERDEEPELDGALSRVRLGAVEAEDFARWSDEPSRVTEVDEERAFNDDGGEAWREGGCEVEGGWSES